MSPFSLYKRQIADWTEITKSGTRQNQKKINQKRDKNVNCILIFFMYLTCQTGHTIADFLFWKNQNKW